MTEMEIEANAALKFEFDKITEAGVQLEPLYGPGYTGMINLGNRCVRVSFLLCRQANAPVKAWSACSFSKSVLF
jgi:ubiquitin carboxyl-terminal hydrolase 5/13